MKETTQPTDTKVVKESEKRYQLTKSMLIELVNDEELARKFIDVMDENPSMKTPIGFQFAVAILKQQKPKQ